MSIPSPSGILPNLIGPKLSHAKDDVPQCLFVGDRISFLIARDEPFVPFAGKRNRLLPVKINPLAALHSAYRFDTLSDLGFPCSEPLASSVPTDARWCEELGLEAGAVEASVLLAYVVGEPLSSAVAAVGFLMEMGHPHSAFVYALVYSVAPKFYSRCR